ncbi:hypothetical protein CW748_02620 [Alteromonadales bacterium alter-6D02]|nr:hypothetical protein CW748_02620 [Alteromonadales bacterium alter-6D02]
MIVNKWMSLLSRYYVILLMWICGSALSFSVFWTVIYYESQYNYHVFEASFEDKVTNLNRSIYAIEKIFLATDSLLTIAPDLSKESFAKLINTEMLTNTGLEGVQWAPLVKESELTQFEQSVRSSGIFDYRIHFPSAQSACDDLRTSQRFPVLYSEPQDSLGHELGLQLGHSCSVSVAMQNALHTHSMVSSSFKDKNDDIGVRLLKPIFDSSGDHRGYISGIIMLNQFIDTLFSELTLSHDYRLVIYSDQNKQHLLYDSSWYQTCDTCTNHEISQNLKKTVPFANQLWHIEFSKHNVDSRANAYALSGASVVIFLTLSLSFYVWMSLNRVRWANQLVSERTKSLRYQANHDELTQLYNKQALSQILQQRLHGVKEQEFTTFSVLFIDLDHFKKVNDTMGHLVGDRLLQQVADRLRNSARELDDIFRFGGDEFVLIIHGHHFPNEITKIAQRILNNLIKEYIIDQRQYCVGASIGILENIKPHTKYDDVLRNADIAMYEAKRQGRGQIISYTNEMYRRLVDKQQFETSLAKSIKHNQLELHFQPIVSAQEQLCGFEALCRWQHPKHGLIMPNHFIEIAEENGFIHQLGSWAISRACEKLAHWIEEYGEDHCPYISLNVSPYQLTKPHIVTQIKQALHRHHIPANLLAIELTESALIENKEMAKQHLLEIRQLGVKVLLDDFGTGFSSLSLLQDFPIDVLKIDRSFILGIISDNHESKKLVRAIIKMAKALNMTTIAEGVEDSVTIEWLAKNGCELTQGYYHAKPLDSTNLAQFMSQRHSARTKNIKKTPCFSTCLQPLPTS